MASSVTLVYQPTIVTIAAIELDASLQEEHTTTVDMTDSPVEPSSSNTAGTDITDHMRKKPDQVKIVGIVTNYPLSQDPTPSTQTVTDPNGNEFQFSSTSSYIPGRAEGAYQALLNLAATTLCTIVTSLRTYTNMGISSLVVPRDAKIGEAVQFTAIFREVQIVQNQVATVARTQASAIPKKNLGKQGTTPVEKSTAASGVDLLKKSYGLNPTGLAQ
jgi:hypothetical protein